jgi:glycosyltransferase involved in cell wall biosynthesis
MILKKHILLLVPGFPKDEDDYLCTPPLQDFILKYLKLFPDTKFSVIAFHYPYERKDYKWNGIKVYSAGGKNSKLNKLSVWKAVISKAKTINKKFPINSIHSLWFGECALIGNYLSRKLKCNHICTLMGQDVRSSNYYLKFIDKNKMMIISLSKNQSDEFFKITKRKIDDEIFWGIEDQDYNINNERRIDLLGVGSLIQLKNYELLIKTVYEIVKQFPKIVCKLVGDGPEFSKLKKMAANYRVDNNIEFTGLISRKEIFTLMKQSKIFIHPSKFEGSGFVFAEALANGMNIVSFNVGYAKQSEKWLIANDNNEFISYTKKLLLCKLSFEPLNIFPISETVQKYHQLYTLN